MNLPRNALVRSLAVAALVVQFHAASAGTINLPALTFQPRGGALADSETQGFLANEGQAGVYYSAVPGLVAGEQICRFFLYARDFDGEHDVTARLVRKLIQAGDGVAFGSPPKTMATVATSGFDADTQRVGTGAVVGRTIDTRFLYWVEIEFTGGFLDTLAVRIETAADCSPPTP